MSQQSTIEEVALKTCCINSELPFNIIDFPNTFSVCMLCFQLIITLQAGYLSSAMVKYEYSHWNTA